MTCRESDFLLVLGGRQSRPEGEVASRRARFRLRSRRLLLRAAVEPRFAALTEIWQAWLLNVAAFGLRALGRLIEATEPMRTTMEINVANSEWKNAAVCASNLSELELTLGEVAGALGDAEQSVIYADRCGDAFWCRVSRVQHGNMRHQAPCQGGGGRGSPCRIEGQG